MTPCYHQHVLNGLAPGLPCWGITGDQRDALSTCREHRSASSPSASCRSGEKTNLYSQAQINPMDGNASSTLRQEPTQQVLSTEQNNSRVRDSRHRQKNNTAQILGMGKGCKAEYKCRDWLFPTCLFHWGSPSRQSAWQGLGTHLFQFTCGLINLNCLTKNTTRLIRWTYLQTRHRLTWLQGLGQDRALWAATRDLPDHQLHRTGPTPHYHAVHSKTSKHQAHGGKRTVRLLDPTTTSATVVPLYIGVRPRHAPTPSSLPPGTKCSSESMGPAGY